MPEYFSFQAVFESDLGRSTQFVDVVPDEFTVRSSPRFRTDGGTPPMWHDTPICEVRMIPAEHAWRPEIWSLLGEVGQYRCVSNEEFAERVFGALLAAIEDAWVPKKFHLVLHSAGYDSRLLSLAIRELYERNGLEWLGQVLFVECGGEGSEFRRIMALEGWPLSFHRVKEQDHEGCFDFGTAWQRMGAGTWAYPANYWWDPVVWGQKRGIVPETGQVQCWSGQGANYVSKGVLAYEDIDFQETMRIAYYKIFAAVPLCCEWVFPFMDFRYIRALRDYGGGRHGIKYIEDVLYAVEPRLHGIENPDPRRCVCTSMSDELFGKAVSDYRNSWYGWGVRPDIRFLPVVNFHPWWGHYALASYCEYACNMGRQVHVDRKV